MPRVYLSPSNQSSNTYAYGNTTEAVQMGRLADALKVALERCGIEAKIGHMISMEQKCAESDAFNADVHLPLHSNAHNGVTGGTRLFCNSFSGEGYKVCQAIFKELAPVTPGTSENIKEYPALYEIKHPKAPTCYVECDFHDNKEIAKWIIEHISDMAEAICKGLCNYFGIKYKATTSKTTTSDVLYKIQIGAFSVKANAEAYLKKAKAAGFTDAYIVEVKK